MRRRQKLQQIDDWLTSQVLVAQQPFIGAVLDGVADHRDPGCATDFIYHEITGYQLSYYSQLLAASPDSTTASGDKVCSLKSRTETYLLSRLQNCDLISHGYFPGKQQHSDPEYLFDNGMILQGFCDSYAQGLDSDLIEPIGTLATAISSLQYEDGSFPAARNLRDVSGSFAADSGCLHIKLVIGLLKTAALLDTNIRADVKTEPFSQAAARLLKWGQSLQQPDGSFIGNKRTLQVTTHAFCYALEGYLYAYHRLDESRYLDIVQNGIDWLISHSDNQGRLTIGGNTHHRGAFGLSRALQPLLQWRYWDETIQTGRILHILYKLTDNAAYVAQRDRIITSLVNSADGPLINCTGRFQANPLSKTFTWPNQFASQLLRFVLDDDSAPDALEALF